MDKFEIANVLREAGLLLSIAGDNQYKARAYFHGAKAIESLSESIDRIIAEDRLLKIPGIGKSLAANIVEINDTGELRMLNRLKEELPVGVVELSQVPGLTLKRIKALGEALQISSIDELEQACRDHKVRLVSGFGEKTELSILHGIATYRKHLKKMLLVHARESASQIVEYLKTASPDENVEIAGEIRRWHEVVDNIQIVASGTKKVLSSFESFPLVTDVAEQTSSHRLVRLADGATAQLTVSKCFAAALIIHTGSSSHVERLKERALARGLSLELDGLFKDGHPLDIECEDEIYQALGLSYIPPELREDAGEIEHALEGSYEDLIDVRHIRGMTHCHTTYSDGVNSVKEMALAAQKLGMEYLTITDHSPTAHYAGGLQIDRLRRQWEEIDEVQEQVKIRLLKGTESDILADGQLDYPDHILEQFDVIIASVHSRFKLDEGEMTKRLIRCMKDRYFKIWGHPLGRLLLRREPIQCHVEKVLDVIAESRAAIEINGDPYRLDLEPRWLIEARKRGIKFIISTDAHSTRDYRSLRFGVHQARRAGVTSSEVLNSYNVDQFCKVVRPA